MPCSRARAAADSPRVAGTMGKTGAFVVHFEDCEHQRQSSAHLPDLALTIVQKLKTREAGLVRYHCNLETSPDFFPKVCTTHTQTDKIRTLEAARRAGLELCSGGLFGMGETMADRIDLACGLRRLEIPSIPLNFLIPIPGTPLADRPPMTHDEVVRTVAVFRLVNPSACLRFAGGRQNLAPETARAALRAGINGAITGDLLTTPGSSVEEERRLVLEAGYSL